MMNEIILSNQNINKITIDHLYLNCKSKYRLSVFYCCQDASLITSVLNTLAIQIGNGRSVRKFVANTCQGMHQTFNKTITYFITSLLIQNKIKCISLQPSIQLDKRLYDNNTSLLRLNNKLCIHNERYRQLCLSIQHMFKCTKYGIGLINQPGNKQLFMNDKCVLPKFIILEILKYVNKYSIL